MLKEVLDVCLKPEHWADSLYMEADEESLYLKRGGKALATWNIRSATIASIRDKADKIMKESRRV